MTLAAGCTAIPDPLLDLAAGTQSYREPSESMMPTLHMGDTVSGTTVRGTYHPKIGDVVAFTAPKSWNTSGGYAIKRVIGIPGSTVECCDAQMRMIIDGKPLDEPYLADKGSWQTAFAPVTVPAAHIWLQGDNRAISLDSRNHQHTNGTGPVPTTNVLAVLNVNTAK
jgi:signal peptidase I